MAAICGQRLPRSKAMAETPVSSAMAREIAEIPVLSERLLAQADLFAPIVRRIEEAKPRFVVLCGRGSSGHVGVYLRYLFETRLGWLTSAAAPRSEEHTSELQSRLQLVCRLLLEKK